MNDRGHTISTTSAGAPTGHPGSSYQDTGRWDSSSDDYQMVIDQSAYGKRASSGRGVLSRVGVRKGYAGYEWDPATGQDHVRHHVYLPEMGRWGRRDPAGYVDGAHLVQHVSSRTKNGTDSSGLVHLACRTDPIDSDCRYHCNWMFLKNEIYYMPASYYGITCDTPWGRKCCVCTPALWRMVEDFLPGSPEMDFGQEAVAPPVECAAVHEAVHRDYVGPLDSYGRPNQACNECAGYDAEIACLLSALDRCSTTACRQIVERHLHPESRL
ncbi:MAG: hypothetical protein JSR77_01540 [Planctomycetes bacterium]|nr:hypothetical protein [Planctomycetota bacterium]